jgi:hypothetical protein
MMMRSPLPSGWTALTPAVLLNKIQRPSGDHAGYEPALTMRRSRCDATSTVQTSYTPCTWRSKATVRPFGDHDGRASCRW